MGRAPCCDKANVKKGPWSPEEDAKLKSYIDQHGTGGNWIALPQKIGLKRCGKSCRLRWLNYLRPNIKHGGFTEEEDNIICSLYISIGSRWSIIAAQLPGRTDNDIKNYWNTRLKKKLLGKQRKEQQAHRGRGSSCLKNGSQNSTVVAADTNYNNHQAPLIWPTEVPALRPIPYSNQEPSFNDHSSIRKLLIKLGGKFSNDHHQIQYGMSSNFDQFPTINGVPTIDMLSSSSSSSSKDAFNTLHKGQAGMEFGEMIYNNNPHRIDGLGFFHGDMVSNNRTETTSGESFEWGEMSSSSYVPVVSNYEGLQVQEGMLLEEYCSAFDELRTAAGVC